MELGEFCEAATADDRDRIAALTREALEAGALGFASSRLLLHRNRDGELIPSHGAEAPEYDAIASAMRSADVGVVEIVTNFLNIDDEFTPIRRLAEQSGRPVSFSLAQTLDAPQAWRWALELTDAANRAGRNIKAQVIGRPTGFLLGLDVSFNPFSLFPSCQAIAKRPLKDKVEILGQPEFRRRLLSERPVGSPLPLLASLKRFDWMFPLGDPPV